MSGVVHATDLSDGEKRLLFWASFLSLTAAGFGLNVALLDLLLDLAHALLQTTSLLEHVHHSRF